MGRSNVVGGTHMETGVMSLGRSLYVGRGNVVEGTHVGTGVM